MKPQSIQNYLSGVKLLHILLGFEYTFSGDFHLRLTVRGIARLNPHVPRRARPITPSDLLNFHGSMDRGCALHCAVYACSLLLFFTMSRLGSILPRSGAASGRLFLTRDCINFSEEGMLITLQHTKTIQFGRRRLHIPLIKLDSALCPVAAYRRSLGFSGSYRSHVAFVVPDGRGRFGGLTKSLFINTFRDVMAASGDGDAVGFTGHSFRRGGASWAFRAGIPGELIQVCGDWSSDAYKKYLEFSMSNRLELAVHFAKSLVCSV